MTVADPAATDTPRPAPRVWSPGGLLLLVAIGFMAYASYAALRDHYRVPHLDDWRILNALFSQPFWSWVFEEQNGHRIPGTLLLLATDYRYFGAHMHLPVAAGVACTWAAFAVMAVVLRSLPDAEMRRLLLAFSGVALFWAASCHDFAWGANQGSEQGTLFVCAALAAVAASCVRAGAGRPTGTLVGLAVLAGLAASFSHGMGLAVWAGLVVAALVGRAPWRVTLALLAVGIVTVAAYSAGLDTRFRDPAIYYRTILFGQPWRVLAFVAAFVGIAPNLVIGGLTDRYPEGSWDVGVVAGLFACVGFLVWGGWLWVRRRPRSTPEVFAVGLAGFVCGGAVLTALNRLPWGMAAMERWVIWSILAWIGVVWMLGLHAAAAGYRRSFAAVVVAIVLSGVPASLGARAFHALQRERLAQHARLLLLGIEWNGSIPVTPFAPDSSAAFAVARRFRREGRGIFADPLATLPGTRLADRFTIVPATRCRGTMASIRRIPAPGVPALQMLGFGLDDATGNAPRLIVVAERDGDIRGLGEPMPLLAESYHIAPERIRETWLAFASGLQADKRYVIYAVLADGRSVCPLAEGPGQALLQAPFVSPPAAPPSQPKT